MSHLPPLPVTAAMLPGTPVFPTLAVAIAAVPTWNDIPRERRITWVSALRTLETLYGSVPEAIPLDPVQLTRRLAAASPAALRLTPGSLGAYKSAIRSVLRRLGVIARLRRRDEPLAAAWQALCERLPEQFISLKLQDFIAWCSDRGILPGEVSNATLAEYAAFRRLNRVKGDPADAVRRCAKAWNRAITPRSPSMPPFVA
jgi:hypothetical protein